MMIVGLTGSIAMGKTETANMFANSGVPVHDSDLAVHDLYAKAGAAVAPLAVLFPDCVTENAINHKTLARHISKDEAALGKIEAIVHPLVAEHRHRFLRHHHHRNTPVVVLDIPLLFETGKDQEVDRIIVVTAPYELQRARALARPGMDEQKFKTLLARQMPDQQKRKKADYIIETGTSLDHSFKQVTEILKDLKTQTGTAATAATAYDRLFPAG